MSLRNVTKDAEILIKYLALYTPIPQNGQTHSNNSSANCRRIVWVCLTILWGWRLRVKAGHIDERNMLNFTLKTQINTNCTWRKMKFSFNMQIWANSWTNAIYSDLPKKNFVLCGVKRIKGLSPNFTTLY